MEYWGGGEYCCHPLKLATGFCLFFFLTPMDPSPVPLHLAPPISMALLECSSSPEYLSLVIHIICHIKTLTGDAVD